MADEPPISESNRHKQSDPVGPVGSVGSGMKSQVPHNPNMVKPIPTYARSLGNSVHSTRAEISKIVTSYV